MDWFRFYHSIALALKLSGIKRAEYIKKHHLFKQMGNNCMVMFRKLPLYSQLIAFGDNVWIASGVTFVTHDVIHRMLKNVTQRELNEKIGCIEIGSNVFVGSNTTILPNVKIGDNTIIASGSLINHDLEGNGVYGGVPATFLSAFDKFVEKRENNYFSVIHKRFTLSSDTIDRCWEEFHTQRRRF